jgi:hypothetical protein
VAGVSSSCVDRLLQMIGPLSYCRRSSGWSRRSPWRRTEHRAVHALAVEALPQKAGISDGCVFIARALYAQLDARQEARQHQQVGGSCASTRCSASLKARSSS